MPVPTTSRAALGFKEWLHTRGERVNRARISVILTVMSLQLYLEDEVDKVSNSFMKNTCSSYSCVEIRSLSVDEKNATPV